MFFFCVTVFVCVAHAAYHCLIFIVLPMVIVHYCSIKTFANLCYFAGLCCYSRVCLRQLVEYSTRTKCTSWSGHEHFACNISGRVLFSYFFFCFSLSPSRFTTGQKPLKSLHELMFCALRNHYLPTCLLICITTFPEVLLFICLYLASQHVFPLPFKSHYLFLISVMFVFSKGFITNPLL